MATTTLSISCSAIRSGNAVDGSAQNRKLLVADGHPGLEVVQEPHQFIAAARIPQQASSPLRLLRLRPRPPARAGRQCRVAPAGAGTVASSERPMATKTIPSSHAIGMTLRTGFQAVGKDEECGRHSEKRAPIVTMPTLRATRSTGPAVRKREYIPSERPPPTVDEPERRRQPAPGIGSGWAARSIKPAEPIANVVRRNQRQPHRTPHRPPARTWKRDRPNCAVPTSSFRDCPFPPGRQAASDAHHSTAAKDKDSDPERQGAERPRVVERECFA